VDRKRIRPDRIGSDSGRARLESWKEIAAYFRRDVTTVQRWEKQENLPVHRLHHRKLGSVYAYRSELDTWRKARAALVQNESAGQARVVSLAVLPLENLSSDPEQEYFADGMTEALITQLSGIHSLRVVSRTSVMQFRDQWRSVPEIAELLNVDVIVEGTTARSDARVRITARLVHGNTAENLWAQSYDRELTDILTLQSDVAQAIARQVEVVMTPAEQRRLAVTRLVSPEAYESYLKGRFHLGKYTRAGLEESVRHFDRAITVDSTYAPAHAGLALAYDLLGTFFIGIAPPSVMRAKAIAAAKSAIDRDQTVAGAHTILANAHQQEWRWGEAEAGHRRAIELNPSDAVAHVGWSTFLAARGRTTDAVEAAARAGEYDPLSLQTRSAMGVLLYFARRYDEAIRQLRNVQEMEPNHVWSLWHLGLALLETSHFEEAIEALERTVAASSRSATPLGSLAMAYGRAGHRSDAQRVLDQIEERAVTQYVPPAAYLHSYVGLGDHDRAFAALEGAYRGRSYIMQFVKVLPLLDPLRRDPRFVNVLRRVALT
jgi:TolB-like protein/Tfp pilus assembly protein PilF